MRKLLISLMMLTSGLYAENIGTVHTKGMIAKDKIDILAFDDPTIKGVTCYVTKHSYGMSLFGSGSSSTSISCRQTGPIKGKLCNKNNIFSRQNGVLFKKQIIDRFYDKKRNVLIYIAYTKDTGGKNASHSISVVPITNFYGQNVVKENKYDSLRSVYGK